MYSDSFNPLHVDLMPVDHLAFATDLPVSPKLVENPAAFLQNAGLDFNDIDLKPALRHRPVTLYLDLLRKGTIKLKIVQDDPGKYALRGVRFNPGKLFHHHNGRILESREAIESFGILREVVGPLLAKPSDASLLIPGCRSDSPSFWKEIEIVMHLDDPDEVVLAALRNIRHPSIRKKASTFEGESITLGTRRGELMISAYRKDLQMDELRRFAVANFPKVVRIEVTLKKGKLLDYLGSAGNTRRIAGQLRLVGFRGAGLLQAHKTIMDQLEGLSPVTADESLPGDNKVAHFIGMLSLRYGESIAALLDSYDHRFKPGAETLCRMKRSALDEISRHPGAAPDLFSPANYENQPCLVVPKLEEPPYSQRVSPDVLADIEKTYGPRR
ncbi:hypothetical protein OKA04_18235 [Luteolibacter flavescens]|uniref:Uncharacterized protein n=1 Tax=Luteolibacter flavescens TaxID=1859460 RepID=A0ABT3FSY5_9BACT|nr:hypothetical protein [Luteolibacter flavescens]MCW1886683.1 hypothetical protein [Luteolibacter flavescens]